MKRVAVPSLEPILRKSFSLIMVSALSGSLLLQSTISADGATTETPILLANCKTIDVIPCIESLSVQTQDGISLEAALTGRTSGKDPEFQGVGYEEYSVQGLSFEGTSKNFLIPRIVYYPYGAEKERDYFAVAVQPSWLNRELDPNENSLVLPNRETSLLCGTPTARVSCNRSNNFNIDLKFTFNLIVPSDFVPVWASGSTKDVAIDWEKKGDSNGSFYRLPVTLGTLEREMVLFTDYYANPIEAIDSSQYADFPADWPNLWVHGLRDRSVNVLGECRQTPFLSVTTNAIYQDLPVWNKNTESIDLKLYASHFKHKGDLNRGFYDLKISKNLAKCFWGIDVSSKTQARVFVSYPGNGDEKVVESVVTTYKDNIFEVKATNFTFSSPTIKATIFQPTPSPDSGTAITPSAAKNGQIQSTSKVKRIQKTISCQKAKQIRRITSINPKCPKGFKQK